MTNQIKKAPKRQRIKIAFNTIQPEPDYQAPLTVACGVGVDSVAMLVGLVERGMRPALITFADTGAEKPETYAYIEILNNYLRQNNFPEVTVVQYQPVTATYDNLYDNCIQNKTVPSLAFGLKGCSVKFKIEVQNKYFKTWQPALDCWARGQKVLKAIGYDAGPKDSRRYVDKSSDDHNRYEFWYPLRDWGWTRVECRAAILRAGLPLPLKSACFFCPATQPVELVWLAYKHPDLFRRAIELEDNARPGFTAIQGLWRNGTKEKPGSWRVFAEREGLITARPDGGFDLVALDPAQCPVHPDELAAVVPSCLAA
jgi:3'-phosphoadenosine 5'-phosphosulfate sulfotransferase (PAPS reductase)/FAD synthetase